MALRFSIKVALVASLGFIFAMSWLVSLVARPLVEIPTPLIVKIPTSAGGGTVALAKDRPPQSPPVPALPEVANRFARPSPVEITAAAGEREGETLLADVGSPDSNSIALGMLPPLAVPDAPILASAAEAAAVAREAGAETESFAPEAALAGSVAPEVAELVAGGGTETPEPALGLEVDAATDRTLDQLVEQFKAYTVRRGDSLVKIMRREWGSDDPRLLQLLLAANPRIAERRDCIFVGERLRIPGPRAVQHALTPRAAGTRTDEGASVAMAPEGEATIRLASAAGSADRADLPAGGNVRWYTVRKRDSLSKIARRLLNDERRWPEIAKLNQLRNANRIEAGARIKLPPASSDT